MPHTASRPLIGITGKAGSGKDTLGGALVGAFHATQHSFAFALKSMLASMLQVPYSQVEGVTDESREWREQPLPAIDKTPRELMLSLGTEWGRDMVHPDIWVLLIKRAWDDIGERFTNPAGFIMTDVRFDNEAEWVLSEGGIILETAREDRHVESTAAAAHRSEAGINRDLISATIYAQKGDLDGLCSRGIAVARELGVT